MYNTHYSTEGWKTTTMQRVGFDPNVFVRELTGHQESPTVTLKRREVLRDSRFARSRWPTSGQEIAFSFQEDLMWLVRTK